MLSPALFSDIFGAGQIGDPLIQMVPFGESGEFDIGTIVSLDAEGKIVKTNAANANEAYGIIAEDRTILDIDSERNPSANVIRRGSFKAAMLSVAEDTSLEALAPRMRELGMFLEGLEAAKGIPFRLRTILPTRAVVSEINVRLDCWVEGSIDDSAKIWFDGVEQVSSTVTDYSHVWATIPSVGTAKVQIRQGSWASNEILFGIAPS